MRKFKPIILRIPPVPKFDIKAYSRELRAARDTLSALYDRRGQPDPHTMDKKAFERELELLEKVAGSKFMPEHWESRSQKFDREARDRIRIETLRKLRALHRRRGMPDPGYMNCPSFVREHELFEQLVRTSSVPSRLYNRYQKIKREAQSRAGNTTNW